MYIQNLGEKKKGGTNFFWMWLCTGLSVPLKWPVGRKAKLLWSTDTQTQTD